MRALLDTNIILDIALNRQPFAQTTQRVFDLSSQLNITLFVTATAITDPYYIARKSLGRTRTLELITNLLTLVEIAAVNRDTIIASLNSDLHDFEDAVQVNAAQLHDITIIITRNESDFVGAGLKVYNPEAFLDIFAHCVPDATAGDELMRLGEAIGAGWQVPESSVELLSDMRR